MKKQDKQNPLFIVHNHHVASCGEPPALDGDDGRYYAYFENSYREQLVYVCDPTTREAYLQMGDAGWGNTYPVVNGVAQGVVLNTVERLWLFIVDQVGKGEAYHLEQHIYDELAKAT
jgi:hypothetical protein